MAADWFEAEADVHSWHSELDRLKRRARARLFRTLALATLATAVVVWRAGKRVPLAESSILIRVTEGGVLWEDTATTQRNMAQFLSDSAHTSQNLLALIEKHKLYRLESMRGPAYALEELRDHVTIEVYRNYFINQRNDANPFRTARISVSFRDEDPLVSFAVATDLAKLVIDSETKRRLEASRGIANVARRAVEKAEAILKDRQYELAGKETALVLAKRARDKGKIGALQVEIGLLQKQVKEQADLLQNARGGKSLADLRHTLDTGNQNLTYQIVDERAPPPRQTGREIRLAMVGLASFLILLPLCAVAIGAFDSRIHDTEDVQRLGLEVVGHVPTFTGFGVGSLASRRAAERRRTRFHMT